MVAIETPSVFQRFVQPFPKLWRVKFSVLSFSFSVKVFDLYQLILVRE
jgi:hypothetical protein